MNPRDSGSPAVTATTILRTLHPRPLTIPRPVASGKNSAEHAFRKRLHEHSRRVARRHRRCTSRASRGGAACPGGRWSATAATVISSSSTWRCARCARRTASTTIASTRPATRTAGCSPTSSGRSVPDVFAAYAPVAARLRPSVRPEQARPVFHVAGQRDRVVSFADQEAAIAVAREVNGVDAAASCGAGCTVYGGGTAAPVMTWIHGGAHNYPRDTSERIAAFFRQHARTH